MTVTQAFHWAAMRAQEALPMARRCASVADKLAQAIENKDLEKTQSLLAQGVKSLYSKDIAFPHPDRAFQNALENLGEIDATTLRNRYPHLYTNQKTSPLILAVIGGFHEGAALLIEKGAVIFEETAHAKSGYHGALGAAIFRGDAKMITLLMNHPSVQRELESKPSFRNYLLHSAVGADNAVSLQAVAACDAQFMEKARVYGTMKPADFTLGTGIARSRRVKAFSG